jgi:protein SCO1/2
VLVLLLSSVLLTVSGCDLSRTFDVKGRVVGFGDDGRTMIVEHTEIKGYMPAMTMSFKAESPAEVEGLSHGQAIGFTLVVTPDSAWVRDVTPLADDALPAHPAGQAVPVPVQPGGRTTLSVGDRVPAFTLVDQDSTALRLSDFAGRTLVVTFIYTRCPLPDYCPLMSRNFQALQPVLAERYGDRVQLLSISFDPENDTPAKLKAYARRYTRNLDTWTFATGTAEQLREVLEPFAVFVQAGDEGALVHNLTTAVIGPDGTVQALWRGNEWSPEDVLEAVEIAVESALR